MFTPTLEEDTQLRELIIVNDIHLIWPRIQTLAGSTFHTKTGRAFTYDCDGSAVHLRNTARSLSRNQFAQALARLPVTGPGALQDLQGPSYIYAILTDERVTGSA